MARRALWKQRVGRLGTLLVRELEHAPEQALRAFLRSLRRVPPTTTNCWWISYRLAPLLRDMIENEFLARREARARLRKLAKDNGPVRPVVVNVTLKKGTKLLR